MKVIACENSFPHPPGSFCPKCKFPHYVVCCFSTPFLYEIDSRLLSGNPGDYLIMTPGTIVYHGPQTSEESFINDWMHIGGADFDALLQHYPLPLNTAFAFGRSDYLNRCIPRIKKELLFKHAGYDDMINGYITETIIKMHRLYQKQLYPDSAHSQIDAAREAFLQNPDRQWTLQQMAELSGYSVSRFSYLYNEMFDKSPKAELIAARIELARQLLLSSSYSITEISEHCGFKSIYYFSKYFKKTVGVTPSEYAKLYSEKSFKRVPASSDTAYAKGSR